MAQLLQGQGHTAANRTAFRRAPAQVCTTAPTTWIALDFQDATGADDGLQLTTFQLRRFAVAANLIINDVSLNEGNAGTTSFYLHGQPVGACRSGRRHLRHCDSSRHGHATQRLHAEIAHHTKRSRLAARPIHLPCWSAATPTPETNETFFVNVTNVTGATVTDGQGQGTIVNDDAAPNLTINDVSAERGNAGTTTFTFTVSLSAPAPAGGVTFDIATADGTATALSDYTAKSLTSQTIPAGSSTYTFDVLVNGDTSPDRHETFFVNITNITNAIGTDTRGQGTIVNDDITKIHDVQGNGATSPNGQGDGHGRRHCHRQLSGHHEAARLLPAGGRC